MVGKTTAVLFSFSRRRQRYGEF